MRCVVLFIIFFSFEALSDSLADKIFYNIHQATRLLEQFVGGRCTANHHKIKVHLDRAKAFSKKSIFKKEITNLENLYNNRSNVKSYIVTEFRMKIHDKAKKYNIKHSSEWYKEVGLCKTSSTNNSV